VSGELFGIGTFSAADGKPFPGLTFIDGVLPVRSFAGKHQAKSVHPEGWESVQGILESWPSTFEALRGIVQGRAAVAQQLIPLASLRVHAPVPKPGTVYCSGANYRKHVVELILAHQGNDATRNMTPEETRSWGMHLMDERARSGTPFVFVKPQSAVTGPFDPIAVPDAAEKPDWELELAVVIGKRARRVSRANALEYVAGYTIANDITLRSKVFRRQGDSPELGMDFVLAKGAPGFLPLGPYIVPAAFVPDPQKLRLTLKLNGQVMQDEDTADMIFTVAHLIEYLSAGVELLPGDVICTGSPAGNGAHYGRFIQDGDVLESSITGLGLQRNRCVHDRL
jgi:2-keto-4-pentenoate hydratase/2-oxohepta-3-ene-1,7-dioic acid hydratase in catechol pathway